MGHLPSGKNKYKIGNKRLYKDDVETKVYEKDFFYQIKNIMIRNKIFKPIEDEELALVATIYFRDFRRDVDTILFCDLLQKYGVIKNDRSIRVKCLDGLLVSKSNPRIEFSLFKIV